MEKIEKVGTPKDVFITCPQCARIYYIDRSFYEPQYDQLLLHCPFCHAEFDKDDSPMTWGR